MTLIIDPKSVSVSKIITDLENFLKTKPDATVFDPFFSTATGKALIEIVAGQGALLSYNNIVARRENFIQFAINRSSLIGISENLGVSVPRGSNKHLTLTVLPNVTAVLPRFSIVGAVKDKDLTIIADTPITAGVETTIEVVVGDFGIETLIIPDNDIATFKFSTSEVSEDLRVLLNGTEVLISSKLEDMQNDFYAVISNPLGAVDISSLNQTSNAFQYTTGDQLTIEFIKLKDFTFVTSDLSISFGDFISQVQISPFIDKETKKQIAVNSPLRHETQARIRGRLDFKKVYIGLDSRIVDTNQRDVSSAIVELTYVRDDDLLFTASEKAIFKEDLNKRILMGIEPPDILDPISVPISLDFQLTLLSNDGDPITAVESVMLTLERVLGKRLNFLSIESLIEKSETEEGSGIRFIETVRLNIASTSWIPATGYLRGQFINPSTPNGLVYENLGKINVTGLAQPEFSIIDDSLTEDEDLIWQAFPVDLCVSLFTWTSSTPKVLGDYIIPTVPNGKMYKVVKFINRSFGNEEIQKIDFDSLPNLGTWRIHFGTEKTVDLPFNATASQVQIALRNLNTLTDIEVTGDYTVGFTLLFKGVDGNMSQPQVEINNLGTDEIQLISFSDIPNSGDWGIEFDGVQTATLSINLSAIDLKTQLELLSNIDSVSVLGDFANGFTVTFEGLNAKQDVPLMIQYIVSDLGTDESQRLDFDLVPDAGTWRIHYKEEWTGELPFNANASLIASELNFLLGLDGVSVSGDYSTGIIVDFLGASGKQVQPLLEIDNTGRNEIQRMLFSTTPDQGTFRVEFDGEETADIPFNSSTAQIENYLEALSNITSISVSGDFVSGLQIEWNGVNGLIPQSFISLSNSGTDEIQNLAFDSVPTTGTFSLTYNAQTTSLIPFTNGVSEVQNVGFSIVPDSGGFTLIFEGQQTSSIAFNAIASGVKFALETLPNIDLVSVTGTFASGFNVVFLGVNQNKGVGQLTIGANTLESSAVPILITPSTVLEGVDGNAQAIEDALNSLSNIDSLDVTGDYITGFEITFTGDLISKRNVNQTIVATNTTGAVITPSTSLEGQYPSQNVKRLGADVVITIESVQSGLIPANNLLSAATPVTITPLELTTGEAATTNLDKSGTEVAVTITEETKGEIPANSLFIGATPIVITPLTLVDAADAEPSWPLNLGDTVIDGGILWVMVELNGTPTVWIPDTDYDKGEYVQPSIVVEDVSTSVQMMAQVKNYVSTSGTVEPIFPLNIGDQVNDNNTNWKAHDPLENPDGLNFLEYYSISQTVSVN